MTNESETMARTDFADPIQRTPTGRDGPDLPGEHHRRGPPARGPGHRDAARLHERPTDLDRDGRRRALSRRLALATMSPEPLDIEIRDESIRLGQLLKLAGLVDDGRVVGGMNVNVPKVQAGIQALIRSGERVGADALRDESVPLDRLAGG